MRTIIEGGITKVMISSPSSKIIKKILLILFLYYKT